MPELGGTKDVRVRCCDRLPFSWLPGFMPNVRGITLWNTIYLGREYRDLDTGSADDVELLLHELVHVGQFRRAPFGFPLRYLLDLARVGYIAIPAEQEARARAAELLAQYLEDRPCAS